MSLFPRGRPVLLGHSRSGPRARVVVQLSQPTRTCVRVPAVPTSYPGDKGPGLVPMGSTAVTELVAGFEGAVLTRCAGNSCLGPKDRGFKQLSRVTRARVRVPTGSISCPGGLGPVSDVPQSRPAVPGDSGPFPSSRVNHFSRGNWALVQGSVGSNICPGRLGPRSECLRG